MNVRLAEDMLRVWGQDVGTGETGCGASGRGGRACVRRLRMRRAEASGSSGLVAKEDA